MIETSRLYISKLSYRDSVFLMELMNQQSYKTFIGDRKISDINKANKYLKEGPLLSYELNNFGLWKVTHKSEQRSIGVCGLLNRTYLKHPDIGYATLEDYQGRGYTHEAINACLKYAFTQIKIKELNAITSPDNLASINLLRKNKFQLIETKDFNETRSNLFYLNLAETNFL